MMAGLHDKARKLIDEFKGKYYIYGPGCLEKTSQLIKPFGDKVLLITNLQHRSPGTFQNLLASLNATGLDVKGPIPSARPNSPVEDVLKIKEQIEREKPDSLLVASGGSGIDAAKAAGILAVLGGELDDYFGVGKVSENLRKHGEGMLPLIPVQTASSSAAHLTKYANITDLESHQKKLIVDEAVVPPRALFDYSLTQTMSSSFTADGAFDGLAHCLEVYYGASAESFDKIQEIALTGIELIVTSLKDAIADPANMKAREALGLATDLGGYAIMIGGTNGAHLTSFSLVDILSHGRACAILNPYYTVFFAPSIHRQLQQLSRLFVKHELMDSVPAHIGSHELGLAVAEGLITLSKGVGFPTKLEDIEDMSRAHIEKALRAAKNPQLEMKLKNMPIPLDADMVEEYMGPVLEAALTGNFSLIKTL